MMEEKRFKVRAYAFISRWTLFPLKKLPLDIFMLVEKFSFVSGFIQFGNHLRWLIHQFPVIERIW